MGGLFSKPKPITMPAVKPAPTISPEIVSEKMMKGPGARPRKKKGRAETIVTGELIPEITNKKYLLG